MLFCSKNKVMPEHTNSGIINNGSEQLKVIPNGPVIEADHVLGSRKTTFIKYFSTRKIESAE